MHIIVDEDEPSERLDKYLTTQTGQTRSHIQTMIEHGQVMVGGVAATARYSVRPGDEIEIVQDDEQYDGVLVAEDIPLEILYMDEDVAVVNKPFGMVVYPAPGHAAGTLMNALKHRAPHLADIGGPLRPGVVHRLDMDTSGVMVVALSDAAYYDLVEQFRLRKISRKYVALLFGSPQAASGSIDRPIGRASTDRKRMSTHTRHGKEAYTTWRVLERFGPAASLVEAVLGTGRTHQIRVHMASIGHPVLGDVTYGRKTSVANKGNKVEFARQMLHARTLAFTHPRTGERLEYSSDIPADMQAAIEALKAI